MQPPMDYVPVAESQPAHEKLHYQRLLEPPLRHSLARANSYQDLHHHYHEHQHQHQHLHLHHHPHNQIATVGYQDMCDEINVKMQVSPVSFGSQSHLEIEKHGLPQNQRINQYQSMGSRKPSEDALMAVKSHEDTQFAHRTCEDSPYSPTQGETVQLVHEGMYFNRQPFSSATLVQPQIKLLCSIGGKIMARPIDGKLRYCGGQTRIIAIDRGLCFAELMAKMVRKYGSPLTLKYQLPGEDLDALVSVSSDEDLQNMLDEYDRLVTGSGNSWLRIFLFTSPLQCENISPSDNGLERENCCANVMQHYINAINGLANNGKVTERLVDGQLENGLNDVLSHHLHQKMPLDMLYTTLAGTCFSKPTLRAPSTPSSAPTSPSVAARQAHHKLCGTGDTCSQLPKDQSKCIALMNGLDLSTPEASHGVYMDASSTLKCDHQSHILVESPGTLHETPFSRGDAMWVRDNEAHSGDPQEVLLHKCEWHRGTDPSFMDTWHDFPKPYGLTNSPCEGHCGHHLAAQPVTLLARQRQMEDDFGRVDSYQHYQSEGHKQLPVLHQSHQKIFPLHREGPAQLQRGSGYDLSCQIVDGQGLSPFSQESTHPRAHSAHVMATIPMYTMGSAPSSPRDFMPSRCSCNRLHSQVHRGISVSLGEHPHNKRPFLASDQCVRKHGVPLPSRFYDSSNLGTDPAVWHCLPNMGKGFEVDEEDHVSCVGKHLFDRSNSRHNLVDCHVKENAAYYGDSRIVMNSLHGHRERGMHQFWCADYNDEKGKHVEMARGFPVSSEFQSHMGDRATNPQSDELGSANGFTAGNLTHIMPSQDYIGDSNIERCREGCNGQYFNHGQTELETGIMGLSDSPSKLKCSHVSSGSPTFRHKDSDYDLSSTLFSSTDAVAGSLPRPSLEPPIWVCSPFAESDNLARERDACASAPAFDCTASSTHLIGGTYNCRDISLGSLTGSGGKNPSFRCMESHARGVSEGTSRGASEPNSEHLSFSAVNHVLEHSLDKASVSYAHESRSNIDHLGSLGPSQPLPSRMLDPVTLDGSAVACISPIYDQSPISSVDVATFSFAKGEETPVVNGVINDKEATSQICVAEQDRTSATINSHSNDKQHYKSGKGEADMAQQATCEQEIPPVSEESTSLLQPSSKHSIEKAAYLNGQESEAVPPAQNKVTSEIVQEEQVGGLASPRIIKEDEMELPATQAEAEAVARGLQIIRNDDLEDLKELGSGTYGTVYHGKWRGSDVAIKRIKATCFMGHPSVQERLISDFWKEAGTLSQLHHPNVVAFYGVVPDGPEGTLATVTEYMVNGSLRQVLLKRDRTIDRKKRLLLAMDAAFGMEYLHSKKIVHFDLKSENLLVNMRDAHRPICKVGDLGLSKVKRRTLVSGGVRGTLPWMAPELLSGKTLVTEKVDVYSFGIVMWELLTGEEPYANMHCGTVIGGIANDTLRPAIPSWCDPSWRELMERCWSGKPADRPDFSTVASELRAIAVSMNIK